MQKIDLHMHSSISIDGDFTPQNLVEKCAAEGIQTIALTDHNSTRGITEARFAAKIYGIQIINGIEIDCMLGGKNLHILGYGVDEKNSQFADLESNILEQERYAGGLRIELIRKCGIEIDGAWLCKHAKSGVVTGELIAEAALKEPKNFNNSIMAPYQPNGWRSDNPYLNFYWDYCSSGKPAYIPIRYIDAVEAIRMIHESGGVAVLAHPGAGDGLDEEIILQLAKLGLEGIEVYSNYHSAEQIEFYRNIAETYELLLTCGSEFHGKIKPTIKLGGFDCVCTDILVQMLVERISKKSV